VQYLGVVRPSTDLRAFPGGRREVKEKREGARKASGTYSVVRESSVFNAGVCVYT